MLVNDVELHVPWMNYRKMTGKEHTILSIRTGGFLMLQTGQEPKRGHCTLDDEDRKPTSRVPKKGKQVRCDWASRDGIVVAE
ncbi:hypothetical protein, conserved [Eimeria tenella]|uniref:Uncharacterized protein n=1 Tax=Eimeria tenella TaxID=5802 RepID=U6KYD4_EIMTE|nr:hypothetical protein, conserved [Eimeria tenella]CDJ41359.1 hypothetical protein, conserved [Eimeria tenella]|eukprot:XP_013232109.1 hypothetical protein, conserved [Eimeria tenella]